ncbi:hypothetical protein BH11CYA1_BH11CYA1_26980 [soil metagenome]
MARNGFLLAGLINVSGAARAPKLVLKVALLFSLCVPTAAWADDATANRPVTDKWALVVGISKFADSSLNLRYPAKDAQDFYNYLISKGNFAKDHVRLLLDERATKENILDQLGDSWLPRAALPDDLVVIFISSHGSSSDADIRGVNYVVAHDTNPTKLFTTGIPMQHLADTIRERVHSDRVLVVLDTCHAGGATSESKGIVRQANADAATIAQGSGQLVICSSDKNQTSWESKQYPNSVFTRSLIEGLQKQGSSSDVSDVFNFVKDRVQQEVVQERGVLQTPVLESSKWTGKDLIIACQPVRPRAGLPDFEAVLSNQKLANVEPVKVELVKVEPVKVLSESSVVHTQAPEPPRKAVQSAAQKVDSSTDRIRSVRDTTASEFLKYHFRAMAFKEHDVAWDDLAPAYTAKFQNSKSAYIASISRHHWLTTSPPDSDFSVAPRQGDLVKVRVKMLKLAGYNATWLYTLRIQDGKWFIESVGNAP